jgi:DNA-binding NtrC family response regulator
VDDSKFARKLLETPLQRMGYEVETAEEPQKAIKLLDGSAPLPDVIISDLKMPTLMDGLGFLKMISLNHSKIPIIVYTSDPHADELVGDMGFKSIVFLKKPVSPNTIQKNFEQFFK